MPESKARPNFANVQGPHDGLASGQFGDLFATYGNCQNVGAGVGSPPPPQIEARSCRALTRQNQACGGQI